MANKFQIKTVMELGEVNEADARVLIEIIENNWLVQSWSNGTNADFKRAIKIARNMQRFDMKTNAWKPVI